MISYDEKLLSLFIINQDEQMILWFGISEYLSCIIISTMWLWSNSGRIVYNFV